MKESKRLNSSQLRYSCDPGMFDFKTTAEVDHLSEELIGQKRAVKAMDLGLRVEQEGYNIFMSGPTGTGRRTYAKALAREKSEEYAPPNDLCYVYNFENSEKPRVLNLPAGVGIHLQEDMEELIEELKDEIPEAFSGEEYEQQKNEIRNNYQKKSNRIMEEFRNEAREKGFMLENTAHGLVPVPLNREGKPINQDEFQQLEEERREELRQESQQIQNELEEVRRKIRKLKLEAQEELDNLEKKVVFSVIEPIIDNLKEKYKDCAQIIEYLEQVQEDITKNLDKFREANNQNSGPQIPLSYLKGDQEPSFTRYKVNLLVNNQNREGAPVVYESNPTYYNLFGKIEGRGQFGTITTDFTMIKKGAVHEANGGYLILKAEDVLSKPKSWETLKRVLINQEIVVENIGEEYQTIPITTLKPEAIPIDIKVIMIGNPLVYQLLYNYDEEFKKLFKVKADFDVTMKRNQANMYKFSSFVSAISDREGLRHFTPEAVSQIIEYSTRLAGDKEKMSTRFNEIIELLFEANAWAEKEDNHKEYISRENVIKAIKEKEKRVSLAEEKIQEMIEREHILVDVQGESRGQINGLSVYQTGQYSFGRPVRITARTFLGQEGVVNIEREVKMSGKVHNKGVMILSGFLGGKYAQNQPLTLSASLTFEQNYSGIDGDSASCAELIALLSALAEVPIKQEIAITGSMNQKGRVQPIGGVNEKIEGFYKVCKVKGLTGEQGVIIPKQNEDNLMLKEEVVDAVEKERFNIYSINNVEEAVKLMTGVEPEEVHNKVEEKLKEFADKAVQYKERGDQE